MRCVCVGETREKGKKLEGGNNLADRLVIYCYCRTRPTSVE